VNFYLTASIEKIGPFLKENSISVIENYLISETILPFSKKKLNKIDNICVNPEKNSILQIASGGIIALVVPAIKHSTKIASFIIFGKEKYIQNLLFDTTCNQVGKLFELITFKLALKNIQHPLISYTKTISYALSTHQTLSQKALEDYGKKHYFFHAIADETKILVRHYINSIKTNNTTPKKNQQKSAFKIFKEKILGHGTIIIVQEIGKFFGENEIKISELKGKKLIKTVIGGFLNSLIFITKQLCIPLTPTILSFIFFNQFSKITKIFMKHSEKTIEKIKAYCWYKNLSRRVYNCLLRCNYYFFIR